MRIANKEDVRYLKRLYVQLKAAEDNAFCDHIKYEARWERALEQTGDAKEQLKKALSGEPMALPSLKTLEHIGASPCSCEASENGEGFAGHQDEDEDPLADSAE